MNENGTTPGTYCVWESKPHVKSNGPSKVPGLEAYDIPPIHNIVKHLNKNIIAIFNDLKFEVNW